MFLSLDKAFVYFSSTSLCFFSKFPYKFCMNITVDCACSLSRFKLFSCSLRREFPFFTFSNYQLQCGSNLCALFTLPKNYYIFFIYGGSIVFIPWSLFPWDWCQELAGNLTHLSFMGNRWLRRLSRRKRGASNALDTCF